MSYQKKKTIYTIELEFNREDTERELYSGKLIYYVPLNLFDDVEITTHRIKIVCVRSRNGDLDQILADWNSTLHKQITKCIAFIAGTQGGIGEISKIVINKVRGSKTQTKNYSGIEISNSLALRSFTSLKFQQADLLPLFKTEKSEVLMIALTFWIKAMSEIEEGARFEGLWRSYNSLYNYISKKPNETEKLRYMRNFILDNYSVFPQSLFKMNALTRDDLRSLQWRKMILNNHDTESKTEQFADFILRNQDVRLNQIFQETLTFRENYLKRKYRNSIVPRNLSLYKEVSVHITNCLTTNKIHNDEVLSFMINKYIYFIRNKMFHGEKIHPTFKVIVDYESQEIQRLNELLSVFIYELIIASTLY